VEEEYFHLHLEFGMLKFYYLDYSDWEILCYCLVLEAVADRYYCTEHEKYYSLALDSLDHNCYRVGSYVVLSYLVVVVY
jgi:hypothetical protein